MNQPILTARCRLAFIPLLFVALINSLTHQGYSNGPFERTDQVLIPIETALLISNPKTGQLCVVMIYPDAIPYSSIGYVSVWKFPTAESFYSLRKTKRLPGLSPMARVRSLSHELHTVELNDTMTIMGSEFEWAPNTRRSSWLKQTSDGGNKFGIWRVPKELPKMNEMSSFEQLPAQFNEESYILGSAEENW